MKKKNILLFMTDEHMLEGVSCYGETPCQTPNIDALARRGMLFRNVYTACPVCAPARASLITGQHIHRHGVTANLLEMGCGDSRLADGAELLPRKLQAQGYRCGYNGKWHISEGILPTQLGFIGYDYPGHGSGGHFYPDYQEYVRSLGYEWKILPHKKDGEKVTGYGITAFPAEATVSYYLASNTIRLIDRLAKTDAPFFVWHNDWGPHGEHWVPQEYYDRYRDVQIPRWKNFDWQSENPYHPVAQMSGVPHWQKLGWESYEEVLKHYYAFCTLIDDQVGRIVRHLEELDLLKDTVIVFMADHGETLGKHGGITNKGWSHFEEIQRIPLIISDPSGVSGGETDALVSLLDVYPTICEYAGADHSNSQGRSLISFIKGRGKEIQWRDSVFVEFFGLSDCATNMVTCRHKNWKYGWTCSNKDELYDLSSDPYETKNLIGDPSYAEILFLLRKKMYTFMYESQYPGAYAFLRNVLGWNIDRQYREEKDPLVPEDFLTDTMW